MKLTDKLALLDTASMTSREIADALNMSYDYVRVYLAQNKVPYTKVKDAAVRKYKPHPKEDRIVKLYYKDKLTFAQIYERTGVYGSMLKKIIDRNKNI